jgi:hypothetical protein
MTKAEKRAHRRKQRRESKPAVGKIAGAVSGGFRAGKRRRGNSLIKLAPRETVTTVPATLTDPVTGEVLAKVRTVVTRRAT